MSIGSFFKKQFIDVIHGPRTPGTSRVPLSDAGHGDSERRAAHGARVADGGVRQRGRASPTSSRPASTRSTRKTLPLLTNLRNWDKLFQSPFKTDVYFFSTRLQTDQRWGTPKPITIRDKEFGAVRLRALRHLLLPPRRSRGLSARRSAARGAVHGRRARAAAAQHDRRQSLRRVRAERRRRSSTWRRNTTSCRQRSRRRSSRCSPTSGSRSTRSWSRTSRCPTSCRSGSTSASA